MLAVCALLLNACGRGDDEHREPVATESTSRWEQRYHEAVHARKEVQKEAKHLRTKNKKLQQQATARAEDISSLQNKVDALQDEVRQHKTKYEKVRGRLHKLEEKNDTRISAKVDTLSAQVQNLSEALKRSARHLMASSQFQDAAAALKPLSQVHPNDPWVLYRLAYCRGQLGANAAAAKIYDKAIRTAQKQSTQYADLLPRLYNNYGVLLMKQDRARQALKWYQKATKADSSYAPAYYNLGKLHMEHLVAPDKAIEAFRQHIAAGGNRAHSARQTIKRLQEASR